MSSAIYKGTIKVKDANGNLVPFMPKTDLKNVYDKASGTTMVQTVSRLRNGIDEAKGRGGIKVMYELPDDSNTEDYGPKTLIGSIVPSGTEKIIKCQASISNPSNGSFFALGEEYQISYRLFNASDEDIEGIALKINSENEATLSLDVAEIKHLDVTKTTSTDDIEYCLDEQRAKELDAVLAFDGSSQFTFAGIWNVDLNCLPDEEDYYDPLLTVSVATTNSPAASAIGYNVGETIQYRSTISNTGNAEFEGNISVVNTCTLRGEISSNECQIGLDASKTYQGSVTVTENDILNGTGWNITCTASGTSFLGKEGTFTGSARPKIAQPNPKIAVSYEFLNSPSDGKVWTDGETARYRILVANTGNLTLTNVEVVDLNSGVSQTISEMAPNASRQIENALFKYEIPAGNETPVITCTASASADAPNSLTTAFQIGKLQIMTDKSKGFQYAVNTTLVSSTNVKTSAPFTAASGCTITVDWGDDTSSEFTSSTSDRTHSYASPGTYAVTVSSDDWSKVTFVTNNSTSSVSSSSNPTLYWFRSTVTALNGMMPEMANTSLSYAFLGCTKLTTIDEHLFSSCGSISSFAYCFYGCTSLTALPENLFNGCTSSASFAYCFYGCTALVDIPSSIFSGCTGATAFNNCFYNCTSLEDIPQSLFKDCIGATNFHTLFRGCTRLKTIPEDLFQYNVAATDFGGVFWSCQNIQSIPEDLLRYNVAATNVGAFFCSARGPAFASFPVNFLKYNVNVTTLTADNYGFFESSAITSFSLRIGSPNITTATYFCYGLSTSGVTRTIYVPAGSTTKTTMQNYVSSFALTIVEE